MHAMSFLLVLAKKYKFEGVKFMLQKVGAWYGVMTADVTKMQAAHRGEKKSTGWPLGHV